MTDNQSWCSSGFSSWYIAFSLYIYIYINDLSDNLESNLKPFADDISMFSVVCDPINIPQ